MTEKNIFVCKLLLLNISGFSSDHSVHPLLLKKINPLFPGNPSLKIERIDPVKPHSTGRRGGGGCTLWISIRQSNDKGDFLMQGVVSRQGNATLSLTCSQLGDMVDLSWSGEGTTSSEVSCWSTNASHL